jgi:hypothetical protein
LNSFVVLAESPIVQGVLTFYDKLQEFFAEHLKEPSPSTDLWSCLSMVDTDGYRTLVDTTMEMDINELWASIFCVNPIGNIYTEAIFKKMKWVDALFEPWRKPNEPEQAMKPVDKTTGVGFYVPFDSLEPLMKRRIHYAVPLNHSIPFSIFL